MSLLNADEFHDTTQLMAALTERFSSGSKSVALAQGREIIGTVLSRAASEKVLIRETAELWLAHPEMIADIESSLGETPEDWD